jgi:hypothetical protein
MHENVGRNDIDALTNKFVSRQPKMFRHTSPFEHVNEAPASLAQHDEPPELEKYVEVHRLDNKSQVLVEQMLPSSQSLLEVHAQFVSMPL